MRTLNQVYLVAGGYSYPNTEHQTMYTSSTELLVHGGSSWTNAGALPKPIRALGTASINNNIFATGA